MNVPEAIQGVLGKTWLGAAALLWLSTGARRVRKSHGANHILQALLALHRLGDPRALPNGFLGPRVTPLADLLLCRGGP